MTATTTTAQIAEKPTAQREENTRLHGRTLRLAQVVWVVLIIVLLGIFIAALPPYFSFLQTTCVTPFNCFGVPTAQHVHTLKSVGLSVSDYAWFNVVFDVIEALICLTLGLVIFWHKSSDRMAWLASLTLIFTGTSNVWYTFLARNSPWPVAGRIFDDVAFIILALFFTLFPNGRFVPGWTRLIPIIYAIYSLMPFLFSHAPSIVGFAIGTTVWVGSITSIAAAQIYRYRSVSTHLERQQTKWVVLGLTTTVMINIGCELLAILIPPLHKPGSFYTLFLSDIELGSIIFIPISVAIAILRSRLWEIDVIINRTLVYGLLTSILALLYVGLVLGLQFLFDRIAGSAAATSPLILIGSTLIIAALFEPLRHRIQNIIDRRFYRRKYDAKRTVANFSATLRGEVELKELHEQLIAVVEETMQPAHVSLWLNKPQPSRSAFYKPEDSPVSGVS
jgi:hypothetical protein